MVGTKISLSKEETSTLERVPGITEYFNGATIDLDEKLVLEFNFIEQALDLLFFLSKYANDIEQGHAYKMIDAVCQKLWISTKDWLSTDYGQILLECAEDQTS